MKPGPKNCITDVSGIKVGHAQDMKLMSGTTVTTAGEAAHAGARIVVMHGFAEN